LAATVVRTLEASAAVLTGGAAPDLDGLQDARLVHRRALDRWAEEALRAGQTPEAVLDDLEADEALRIVAYLVLALGGNALIAAGGRLNPAMHLPAETPRDEGLAGALGRVRRTVQTHLAPTSSVLHNSLRVGVGLALAVFLSRLLQLDHAFWVVLGTLSVLRSNALATGRTTLEALAGTAVGVAVGALLVVVIGTSAPVLWATLPLGIFLAAYAASTIGFVAGQAAFTVVVIILFNVIAPQGWRIGLTRIEDVAIGTGISLLAGILLWPHGARGELRRALAGMYRTLAPLLGAALDQALGRGGDADTAAAWDRAIQAQERAGEAFDQFLHERKATPLDPQTAASLLASGAHAVLAADLLTASATTDYRVSAAASEGAVLQAQAAALVVSFLDLADWLETGAPLSRARVSEEALRDAAVGRLRQWQDEPAGGPAAIAAVGVAEWIEVLGRLVAGAQAPVADLLEATRAPWWR
jgi:uncharacterized membrane protein YccC